MKLADPHATDASSALAGRPRRHRRRRVTALVFGAAVTAATVAVTGCSSSAGGDNLALAGNSSNSSHSSNSVALSSSLAGAYAIVTLNDGRDVTFNQLLGITNKGIIAGYFGSGAAGHPNKGYALVPQFAQHDFLNENFPGSVQTQVIGINANGVTVGFWSTQNNANNTNNNFGFYWWHHHFYSVNFPTRSNASPPVNQLLGVNDANIAVGFYTDAAGVNHGYEYSISSRNFFRVTVPGNAGASLTAAAINDHGDVAGFYNKSANQVDGFLKWRNGTFVTLAYPGAASTQATGVNDFGEVVGNYTTGSGNAAVTHGFTWRNGRFSTVNVAGASSTVINGVNDLGDLVGFYTDAKGNTDGLLAVPLP
jgi:probable HAF family extracellular repeat protein